MNMCRTETRAAATGGRTRFGKISLGAFAALSLAFCASAAMAQEEEGDQPFPLNCQDGTRLQALFTEKDVTVTLADGSSVTLPFKTDDPDPVWTDGKRTLTEKGDVLEWTVGKKSPTVCSPEDGDVESPFDPPVAVDNVDLPVNKDNPDAKPSVNCYRFKGFMVKEVDLGEVGAEKLAILPENAKCERDTAKETPISDPSAGYFLGVKNDLVFFQAADGVNGGMPFVVFDTKTGKKLLEDNFEGADFEKIEAAGGKLVLDYVRTFSADCSLLLDAQACAEKVKKETGLGTIAPLPDCGVAYEEEKKRTPEYAAEIEQLPSVISYEVTMTFDGTTASYAPRAGETSCRVPD